jgi:hypothetical protein
VGPFTVLPGESAVLADTGKFTFTGLCVTFDGFQVVALQIATSVAHSSFFAIYGSRNSLSGAGSVATFGDQNMTTGFMYGLASSANTLPAGTKVFGSATGEAVAPGGVQQVSYDLHADQNARGLTGNKCTFGGTGAYFGNGQAQLDELNNRPPLTMRSDRHLAGTGGNGLTERPAGAFPVSLGSGKAR